MYLLGLSTCHLALPTQDKIQFLFRDSITCFSYLFIFKLVMTIPMSRAWKRAATWHQPPPWFLSGSFSPSCLGLSQAIDVQ